jgi:hypothetical protein
VPNKTIPKALGFSLALTYDSNSAGPFCCSQ